MGIFCEDLRTSRAARYRSGKDQCAVGRGASAFFACLPAKAGLVMTPSPISTSESSRRRVSAGSGDPKRGFLDDAEPFLPLPADQACPLFEWGLNWCMASRPGFCRPRGRGGPWRQGFAASGFPGAGKAPSVHRFFLGGWRLLSDELALLIRQAASSIPSSSDQSEEPIDRSGRRFPGAALGPRYLDTRKGTIALATPPAESVKAAEDPARCLWVVFFPLFCKRWESWCEEVSGPKVLPSLPSSPSTRTGWAKSVSRRPVRHARRRPLLFQIGYRSTEEASAWSTNLPRVALMPPPAADRLIRICRSA